MLDPTQVTAAWWSYAEGNRTALTAVVILVALAAAGYVGRRLVSSVRQRKRR
jgi:uncharacterized membrane protein YfcA